MIIIIIIKIRAHARPARAPARAIAHAHAASLAHARPPPPVAPPHHTTPHRALLDHTTQPYYNLACALPITPANWCHWALGVTVFGRAFLLCHLISEFFFGARAEGQAAAWLM